VCVCTREHAPTQLSTSKIRSLSNSTLLKAFVPVPAACSTQDGSIVVFAHCGVCSIHRMVALLCMLIVVYAHYRMVALWCMLNTQDGSIVVYAHCGVRSLQNGSTVVYAHYTGW